MVLTGRKPPALLHGDGIILIKEAWPLSQLVALGISHGHVPTVHIISANIAADVNAQPVC